MFYPGRLNERSFRFYAKSISALFLGLFVASTVVAQEETPVPSVDRLLTGTADLGDLGRFVGPTLLGTVDISSNNLLPNEDGQTPTARSITINENGFAWTSSGLLLRNGSGSDIVFNGSVSASETHSLEVYYFGNGPRGNGVNVPLGEFSIENFSLGDDPVNEVVNSAGDSVQAFGGFWEQRDLLRNASGTETTFSDTGRNPFSATGEVADTTDSFLSRTTSSAPAPNPDTLRPFFSAPSFRVDEESLPLQRTDALFEVEPLVSENVGQLDLSGIEISVSGQSVVDRSISGGTVDLGRFIREDSTLAVQRDETVTLRTFGTDATRTRLNLNSFDVGGDGAVSASLANPTVFDSENSTAEVSLSGSFDIDRNVTGRGFVGHNVGSEISSLENLAGENTQDGLSVGYTYAVVDNNTAVSQDVTVFKIGDFDTTGDVIFNRTVGRGFGTDTHTAISVNPFVTLDNSSVQSVTLSEGNGITGEGLEGEQVIAETTFNVHTRQVAPSQLVATEGEVGEGGEIRIENNASPGGLTATAFVVSSNRVGSDRWFFPASDSVDLDAGESVTLTPTFDETGLEVDVAEGSLGRNFRTRFSVDFQDGIFVNDNDAVPGTVLADDFAGRFDLFGSAETRQQFEFVVERAIEQEAASGSLALAAGVSLRDTGINLTNALDNTTEGFQQTTVEILDGFVGGADGIELNVEFSAIADALEVEAEAVGFESLTSDIARIDGLDGVLHTLQLSFNLDEDLAIADASLLWFDEGDIEDTSDDTWVNAILGNSDIESYDLENDLVTLLGEDEAIVLSEFLASRQVNSSYTDYLLSLAEGEAVALGTFGFDVVNGVAWAVIDHNSSFATTAAAIPEPSSGVCLLAGLLLFSSRRRRWTLVG